MANLTSLSYPIYSTGTYECGLTLNLNLVSHFQSNVILGGFCKGKTLERLKNRLPFSRINVFKFPDNQQQYSELSLSNDPLISVIPYALKNLQHTRYSEFNNYSAKVNEKISKQLNGGLNSTDERDKCDEHIIRAINLTEWIQNNNVSNIAHIHLDIESEDLDILEQFKTPLYLMTHQISIELRPSQNETLLKSFRRLWLIMKYHKFIPLIIDKQKVLPFKDYRNYLSNSRSCKVYCFSIKQYTAITSLDLVNEYQGFKF